MGTEVGDESIEVVEESRGRRVDAVVPRFQRALLEVPSKVR